MNYDEGVKKGAIYVPGYNPPAGTVAAAQKRREQDAMAKKSWGGGGGGGTSGGCFVATAVFGDYDAPEVVFLRAFRDESLSRSAWGRGFIRAYYTVSPPAAKVIAKSIALRGIVRRALLQPIISLLRRFDRRRAH